MSPEEIVERVLYKDSLMLVINKPAGVPVHAGPGGGINLEQFFDALKFGFAERPGLAHRLDRDTSGCLILGRQRKGLARLGRLFSSNRIKKTYWAVVKGHPKEEEGIIDLSLGKQTDSKRSWWMQVDPLGQAAITEYRVMGKGEEWSWLELYPKTGRTHQIRVHCATGLGCPLIGDPVYGAKTPEFMHIPMMLHAAKLEIPLYQEKPPIIVTAPPPLHMKEGLQKCGWKEFSHG